MLWEWSSFGKMVYLHEYNGSMLEWKKLDSGQSNLFQLMADRQVLATFEWTQPREGRSAVCHFDGAAVWFRRVGMFTQEIQVGSAPRGQEVHSVSFRGTPRVVFADTSSYTISNPTWGNPRWTVVDRYGTCLMTVTMNMSFNRTEGVVSLLTGRERDPHLPMLIALTWFIIITWYRTSHVGGQSY